MRNALPALLSLLTAALLSPVGAQAELGGTLASVQADGRQSNARIVSVTTTGFTRHDLMRPNGGTVSEFTNAADQVFAVTWSGPGKPDLRTLLGRYFATFQAAGTVERDAGGGMIRSLRRPVQVAQADLQIQTGGHMGWFHGVAYVPSLAPPGFAPDDLPQP